MADLRQLEAALVNADKAGDVDAAKMLANEIVRVRAVSSGSMSDLIPRQDKNVPQGPVVPMRGAGGMANFAGPTEAALSLGSGLVSGAVAPFAVPVIGAAKYISGKAPALGGESSINQGNEAIRSVQNMFTYRPRSEFGQEIVSKVGGLLSESKIAGLGPTEAIAIGNLAGPASRQLYDMIPSGQTPRFMQPTPPPQMVGMGAAETAPPALRIERAQQLPVPIKLTKGQATRSFADQQFEREAAKSAAIGEPLRQRFAQQNAQIPQNLEFFADQTGAQAGSRGATGKIVTDAIIAKAKKVEGRVNAAYQEARAAGAMQEPVNVAPLSEYLQSKQSQFRLAGVLEGTLDDISERAAKTGGVITINDLEDVRKAVVAAGRKDATNGHYAREINQIIDSLTENVGGKEYRYARRLYQQYKNEFENVGLVDRLMSYKPGTRDRMIAFEDVVDKSIFNGSLDDVRAVRRTLQTAGAEGEAAWKEMQGATVKNIMDEATKNTQLDINGRRVVSPAAFDRIVTELDKDGKLDFVFGKQGAQQMRNLRDTALDTLTSPPGSINTSNTSSAILNALDSFITKLPLIGTPIEAAKQAYQNTQLSKRVQASLNPSGAGGLLQKR